MSTISRRLSSKQPSTSKEQRLEVKSLKLFIDSLVHSVKTGGQIPDLPRLKHFSILTESLEELSSLHKEEEPGNRVKNTIDIRAYQAEFESIQREVDQLRSEVLMSCSTLHYVLEEGERLGIRKPKPCSGLRGYVEAVKDLIASLFKDSNNSACIKNNLESPKKRSVDSYEFKSSNDNETIILSLLVSVLSTAKDLQGKVFSYATCLRKIWEIIHHERENLKSLLQVQGTHRKPPSKLRAVFKAVLASVRLLHLPKSKFCIIRGLKVNLIECERSPGRLTMRSLLYFLDTFPFKKTNFQLFNASLLENLKALKRLSVESKSVISLLIKEHNIQKEDILQLTKEKEKLELNKQQSFHHLSESNERVLKLEEQVRRFQKEQVDPEEFEEVLVELESHKRALKGLTNKYNQLEQTKNALQKEYLNKINNVGSV